MAKIATQDEIDKFIESLIKDRDFGELEPEVLDEMKLDLTERLNTHINVGIIAALPPDKLNEFQELVKSGSDEEVLAFCRDAIPNLQEELANIMIRFRTKYLSAQI